MTDVPVIPFYGADEPDLFAIELLNLAGADQTWWTSQGFATEVVDTEFTFDSLVDAKRLLSRYLGRPIDDPPLRLDYSVGVFTATA